MRAAALTIEPADDLPHQLLAGPAVKAETVMGDLGPALPVAQHAQQLDGPVRNVVRMRPVQLLATLDIHVAGKSRENAAGVKDLRRGGLLLDAHPLENDPGSVGGVHLGGPDDVTARYGGQAFRLGRRVSGYPVAQLGKAVAPPRHELPVVQPSGDDVLHHGQQHGRVGTGLELKPEVGLLGDGAA